jgi:ribose 1,5-bisphosphokinase
MSVLSPSRNTAESIGPGRFILLVGPSGAGKDTIIAGAKAAYGGDSSVVFPRRVVTRKATDSEDHDSLDDAGFERARNQGAFALCWQAHGLHYGIPCSADADIRAGRTVICNVSRGIIAAVHARYARVTVVLVTAPAEVLADRLYGRARTSDGPISVRIERNVAYLDFSADVTIDNSGSPDAAIRQLLTAING